MEQPVAWRCLPLVNLRQSKLSLSLSDLFIPLDAEGPLDWNHLIPKIDRSPEHYYFCRHHLRWPGCTLLESIPISLGALNLLA